MKRILEREFNKFGIRLGLDRINRLLGELGDPHLKLRSIHVAGTNGKGSVCAMAASILKEAGYKIGMYTSPHLLEYNERIRIGDREIGDGELEKYFKAVKPRAKMIKATIFEVLTAIAFKYFADKKVDLAVVEVGMGGRFDATNVLVPEVSVITNVDLEHTEYLGKTLPKIAFEKAGIIKPAVPVVTAENKKEALAVIKTACARNKSPLQVISSRGLDFNPRLLGPHQKINAAVAVKAVELLKDFQVTKKNIAMGLQKVKWPGRFQVIRKKPFFIIDGAHNPAGARALKVTIKERIKDRQFVLVIGVQKNKDAETMARELALLSKDIIVTRSTHEQAMPLDDLYRIFAKYSDTVRSVPDIRSALGLAEGKNVLVCGSIFLLADLLRVGSAMGGLDVN